MINVFHKKGIQETQAEKLGKDSEKSLGDD